jgi:hypothetical protein
VNSDKPPDSRNSDPYLGVLSPAPPVATPDTGSPAERETTPEGGFWGNPDQKPGGVWCVTSRDGKIDFHVSHDPEDIERARQTREENDRRRAEERARQHALWGPRSEKIRGSLRALTTLLDRAIAADGRPTARSTAQWREMVHELHFHFPLAEAARVYPQEFRAAAALAEIWIPKNEDRVAAALEWACGHTDRMRRLHAAVREGRPALPWRVLGPLGRLRAYEVRPHRSGYAIPAPSAATLAALPELRRLYLDFDQKIVAALSAGEALQEWRYQQMKLATQGDAPLRDSEFFEDRIPREELQAMANQEREYAALVALRRGDQLVNAELTDDTVHELHELGQKVRAHCRQLAEYLAGTKLGLIERGGAKTLKVIGDVAAGLARAINPRIKDHREYPKGGVYRTAVQERVVAIIAAVYGVDVPPAVVTARTLKRSGS